MKRKGKRKTNVPRNRDRTTGEMWRIYEEYTKVGGRRRGRGGGNQHREATLISIIFPVPSSVRLAPSILAETGHIPESFRDL